ncbi:aminoacyl-tRNA hydrolase [Mycoplasmopsis agassizii]|uniref:Peptidyl-tRNA hydrolase n=1 Tax=Mycoplasmopsis agassizii TaxID=33922 RepID=A0A269TID3_9BACT|nr:aminoacyl-tRNA hydrolase [Mycoplasmopsis agassizii]PAK21204.1 aminoacyl-tRNA hydrolase [Mycoplasmopsis agassizii]
MKLIVGLGNPGKEYENTKHNAGFMVLDSVAAKLNLSFNKEKFNGVFCKEKDFILAKPTTYMNNSGDFVVAIKNFYNIDISEILIVYDDKDFKVGQAVFKPRGSSAGQKGIKDIINKLGTEEIKRIRVGIGQPDTSMTDHVLSPFASGEREKFNKVIDAVSENILTFIFNDMKVVVDRFKDLKKAE